MSEEQSKALALRLADAIHLAWLENVDSDKVDVQMLQDELRRLHESNKELLEALRFMVDRAYMPFDHPGLISARFAIANATKGAV